MKKIEPKRISRLVTWTNHPVPAEAIFEILKALNDDELLYALSTCRNAAGRVAWLEYGKRSGFFDFNIYVQLLKSGATELRVEAEAEPVVEGPTFVHTDVDPVEYAVKKLLVGLCSPV